MKKDVFISYKSEEITTAKWVRDYLIKCGLSVWMAPDDIAGGSSYAESIPDAIENCKAFVLILSDKAQESKWVTRELDQAINDDKKVLPFMIKECQLTKGFKFYLSNIQFYPAYSDMSANLMTMTKEIMATPGITITKPEEKKPEENPLQKAKAAPKTQKDPDFTGLGLRTEQDKIRYAVNESMRIYGNKESTAEERNRAFDLLQWAANKNDAEACFRYGVLLTAGRIRLKGVDSIDRGMYYLERADHFGHKEARTYMNRYCTARYHTMVGSKYPVQAPAPLRDLDGWKFKIKHTGKLIPIQAELVFQDNRNVLFLDVKVNTLINDDEIVDRERFMDAVEAGFRGWEGEYTVFGGQKLDVIVNVKFLEFALLGCVNISSSHSEAVKNAIKLSGVRGQEAQSNLLNMANNSLTFTTMGRKNWSMRSTKNLFINDSTGRFDNYAEITRAVRNSFGSLLGIEYMGNVPKGTYPELDAYYIDNGRYNLVMSTPRGMVTNNDIEMVILALSENQMQYFAEDANGHKPSKALGKGN